MSKDVVFDFDIFSSLEVKQILPRLAPFPTKGVFLI